VIVVGHTTSGVQHFIFPSIAVFTTVCVQSKYALAEIY